MAKTASDLGFHGGPSNSDAAQAFRELVAFYRAYNRESARELAEALAAAQNGDYEVAAPMVLSLLPLGRILGALGRLWSIAGRIGPAVTRTLERLASGVRDGIHREVSHANIRLPSGSVHQVVVEESWVKNPMLQNYGHQAWDVHLVARTAEGHAVTTRSFVGHLPSRQPTEGRIRLGYPKEDFFLTEVKEGLAKLEEQRLRQQLVEHLMSAK